MIPNVAIFPDTEYLIWTFPYGFEIFKLFEFGGRYLG